MKTKTQIESEIKALEGCKAYAPRHTLFGDDNHKKIDLQIQFLRGEIDMTADEWNDFSSDEQSSVFEAQYWVEDDAESPSSGWDDYKAKGKKK